MATPDDRLWGLVLAAGASTRLGEPKQQVRYRQETLLQRAVALTATACAKVVVVLGHHAEAYRRDLQGSGAAIVYNAHWASGMGTSLSAGIRYLPTTARGALVMLCDQYRLTADDLARLTQHWDIQPQRPCAAEYGGHVGVPAIFPLAWFERLRALHGEVGAAKLLARAKARISLTPIPNAAYDLDTPADLAQFRAMNREKEGVKTGDSRS